MIRVSNAEQSDQTQRALLAAARALFAERGYGATPTEAIVARAGVTRGALHYHFQNKAGLFYAVYTEMEGELMQGILQSMAAAEGDEWQRILRAIDTFLDLSTAPAFQRVLYVDGPAVLNSAVPNPAGLSLIRQSLELLMTQGYIAAQPLESLAQAVVWGLSRRGLIPRPSRGSADRQGRPHTEYRALVHGVADSLLTARRRGREPPSETRPSRSLMPKARPNRP